MKLLPKFNLSLSVIFNYLINFIFISGVAYFALTLLLLLPAAWFQITPTQPTPILPAAVHDGVYMLSEPRRVIGFIFAIATSVLIALGFIAQRKIKIENADLSIDYITGPHMGWILLHGMAIGCAYIFQSSSMYTAFPTSQLPYALEVIFSAYLGGYSCVFGLQLLKKIPYVADLKVGIVVMTMNSFYFANSLLFILFPTVTPVLKQDWNETTILLQNMPFFTPAQAFVEIAPLSVFDPAAFLLQHSAFFTVALVLLITALLQQSLIQQLSRYELFLKKTTRAKELKKKLISAEEDVKTIQIEGVTPKSKPPEEKLDPKEIERKKAYDEGLKKGIEEGKQKGTTEGHREGLVKGLEERWDQGVQQGLREGLRLGLEKGFKQGHDLARKEILAEIVKKMLAEKIDTRVIHKITGIDPKSQIKEEKTSEDSPTLPTERKAES